MVALSSQFPSLGGKDGYLRLPNPFELLPGVVPDIRHFTPRPWSPVGTSDLLRVRTRRLFHGLHIFELILEWEGQRKQAGDDFPVGVAVCLGQLPMGEGLGLPVVDEQDHHMVPCIECLAVFQAPIKL